MTAATSAYCSYDDPPLAILSNACGITTANALLEAIMFFHLQDYTTDTNFINWFLNNDYNVNKQQFLDTNNKTYFEENSDMAISLMTVEVT